LYIKSKLHPEDGFMKAETCSCCVLLINYILCNKVVLDCKFIYFILVIIENTTGDATPGGKNFPPTAVTLKLICQ